MEGPGSHCDDELGRCEGEGKRLVGEGDYDGGMTRRLGEVMDVQRRVPRGGDKEIVLSIVEDRFDARAVGGENGLVARSEVDPVSGVSLVFCLDRKPWNLEPTVEHPNPTPPCMPPHRSLQSTHLRPALDVQTC